MNDIRNRNRLNCEKTTLKAWAAWYEGEEAWGWDDDSDNSDDSSDD